MKSWSSAAHSETASLVASLVLPMVLALLLLPHQAQPTDDAFISFRYAWNLVAGNGLVYNAGERVEGFSNPLWTLLSAAPIALGAAPYPFMRAVSVLSLLALIAALFVAATRPDGSRPRFVLSTWLFASSIPALSATESGLETTFFAALVFGVALAHERASAAERFPRLACALAALAAFTRPEAPALVAVLVLARARRESVARWLAPLCAAAAAAALLAAARLAYYGELVPNTFHAKIGEHAVQLRLGLRYLADWFLAAPLLPVIALAGAWLAPRAGLRQRRQFLALSAFVAAYAVQVGGDWMPHFRFLVVLEPFLLVWADEWCYPRPLFGSRRALGVACALLVFVAAARARECRAGLEEMAAFEQAWDQCGGRVARWLRDRGASGTVAIGDIGVVGWENRERLRILDINGLTDKAIARIPGRHMRKIGPAFRDRIFGARPDYIVFSGDHHCGEPKDDSGVELSFDLRFKARYRLATQTNEGARYGWCVFARAEAER